MIKHQITKASTMVTLHLHEGLPVLQLQLTLTHQVQWGKFSISNPIKSNFSSSLSCPYTLLVI